MKKKLKAKHWVITQLIAGEKHYYCGISKATRNDPRTGADHVIVGMEWGTNLEDAEKYLNESVAATELKVVVENSNPFATYEPVL